MPPDRKPFLLRLDPQTMRVLQRWAEDELRSLNAQIEYVLRSALIKAGRMRDPNAPSAGPPPPSKR